MVAIELAIGRVLGVGLQGGQMVRPALQEQLFGGGPVSVLQVEKCPVHAGARQFVPPIGLVGEVGRQLLLDAQGLVVVLLRLRQPARA